MELRQLRYFLRIVELGSVSKAAKDLYIAQPALSSQIANLETELDVRLLSRSVRGVSPTAAGKALYLHAQAVLRQIERLKFDVVNTAAKPGGPVSVGLPTSAANVLAGPLIAAVQKRYPDIRLRIVESLSGHLLELVATGRLELSLLFDAAHETSTIAKDSARGNSIQWIPLIEENLYLLSKPGEGDTSSQVSLQAAADIPLVLPEKSNVTRQIIERSFADAGLTPTVIMELDSLSTIQSIIESGQAATILSLSALVGIDIQKKLSVRPLGDPPLRRRLALCCSDVLGMGAAAEAVSALIPELVHDLLTSGRWAGTYIAQNGNEQ